MVDPVNFTNYNRSDIELEEMILFSVLVAGKNAITTARCLENFLRYIHKAKSMSVFRPFKCLKRYKQDEISVLLKKHGIGCYKNKARSIFELVNNSLDLRTCTFENLVSIYGIGFKTAEMFLMHSRKDYIGCAPDVHILRYLREEHNLDVPKTTPGSIKKCLEIKSKFIEIANQLNEDPTDLDLRIWRKYSGREVA